MSICLLGSAINWADEKTENGFWAGYATTLQPLDMSRCPSKIQIVGSSGNIKEFQMWNNGSNWVVYMSICGTIKVEFRYEQWADRTVPSNSIAFPENS